MGRLENIRIVDPVLTNLARGYKNSALVAESLAPVVDVAKEAGKIPQFGKEAFYIYNTERAIRAKSNRISPQDRSSLDYVMTEHDLEYPLDYREEDEDFINLKMYATNTVSDALALRKEKISADIFQDLNNYASSNKTTLSAGDKFDNDASSPFLTIETAKFAIRSKIGRFPNVAVLGATSFKALRNHAKVLERIKYTQNAIVTIELLQGLFGIDKIVVGSAVYSTDAGVFTDIWSDNMILAYVPSGNPDVPRSVFEPAFAYTLRKKNFPVVDVYDEAAKVSLIRSTDLFVMKMVGAEAGYIINDTNA